MEANGALHYVDSYPVFVTEKLAECRDFYREHLGFEAVFEATWFVMLSSGGERPVTLAFMHPEHPSAPPAPSAYRGDGAFLTLQVADAAKAYEQVTSHGLACDLPLRDEPWGQRRFGVVDPAGVWVDIVEQTEPQQGWWNPYLVT